MKTILITVALILVTAQTAHAPTGGFVYSFEVIETQAGTKLVDHWQWYERRMHIER